MLPRIYTAISSTLPAYFSATLSSSASSSVPSAVQIRRMSVQKLVDSAIEENQVVVFSKSWCPYCKKAKNVFATEFPNVKAAIYELDERDDGVAIQEYLQKKTGQRTVPSVFVNKEHIGGGDDTVAAFKQGRLAKLIAAA